ncbi:hypothetical protein ILFOPFJJ_05380 [Ensifer psoraleae]|nr:hypothetical protein [Sinorhizobium psoraleae]
MARSKPDERIRHGRLYVRPSFSRDALGHHGNGRASCLFPGGEYPLARCTHSASAHRIWSTKARSSASLAHGSDIRKIHRVNRNIVETPADAVQDVSSPLACIDRSSLCPRVFAAQFDISRFALSWAAVSNLGARNPWSCGCLGRIGRDKRQRHQAEADFFRLRWSAREKETTFRPAVSITDHLTRSRLSLTSLGERQTLAGDLARRDSQ